MAARDEHNSMKSKDLFLNTACKACVPRTLGANTFVIISSVFSEIRPLPASPAEWITPWMAPKR